MRGRTPRRAGGARAGARPHDRRPGRHLGPPPDPRRRADDRRRRAPRPRPRRLPRARRGRAVPGVGDAAVRAGQPGRRDDGPPPAHDVAAADPGPGAAGWSWRRVRALRAAARPPRRGRRAARRRHGERRDRDDLVAWLAARRLPARGAGRAPRRGRGARLDRRRVPVHRRHARCASTSGATRSTGSPSSRWPTSARPTTSTEVEIFAVPRAAADRRRARPGPASWSAREPWGREQWERLAEGLVFDGMESWLPWLVDDEQLLADLIPADGQVLLIEPRRMRDRAGDILAEEADLATPPGPHHLGRARRRRHPAPAPARSTGCWPTPRRRRGPSRSRPTGPTSPPSQSIGLEPGGRRRRGARRPARAACSTTATGSSWPPTPRRRRGAHRRPAARATGSTLEVVVGRSSAAASSRRQAGGARRGRPHRPPPRPPRRARAASATPPGSSTTSSPATTSCTTSTASPATAAWSSGPSAASSATTCCSSTAATTSSTSRPTRSTRCATTPAATARRCRSSAAATGRRPRPGCGPRSQTIAQELVVLYQKRLHSPGHAFPEDTPWQRELEDAFPYRETPDQLKAIDDVKADMEAADPDGPPGVRRRRLRQDRGRHPGRVQGDPGRQAGRGARAHHAAGAAALPDLQRPLRRLPGAGRGAVAASSPRRRPSGWPRACASATSTASSAPTACCPTTSSSRTSACSWSTRSSASASATRSRSSSSRPNVDVLTLTATPIPRTLEMSLTGIRDLTLLNTPPAERQPILTYVGEEDERAVAEAIRRELLREGQVFFVHNRVQRHRGRGGPAARARARGPRRGRPRPDGRGHASSRSSSTSGRASSTCWSAPRSSSRASTCPR